MYPILGAYAKVCFVYILVVFYLIETLHMNYFKVVNEIASQVKIDTKKTNYGKTLIHEKEHGKFIECVVNSSKKLNLPFDFYIMLNNNIAMFGNDYLNGLPKSDIYNLTTFVTSPLINDYSKYTIHFNELKKFIESIDNIGINFFNEGFYLWEYLYELERSNSSLPKRGNSFFLFDNLIDCEYYIQNHKGGGVICEVELTKTDKLFKGDMNLLDQIENFHTFSESKKIIEKYWNQGKSDKPVFEYLFEGECLLKPIK